jgi:hypothetical protein
MSTTAGFAIKKLGESNYKTWQSDMTDVLIRERLWLVTAGDE